jgi:hypothetical protein
VFCVLQTVKLGLKTREPSPELKWTFFFKKRSKINLISEGINPAIASTDY